MPITTTLIHTHEEWGEMTYTFFIILSILTAYMLQQWTSKYARDKKIRTKGTKD